MTSLIVQIKRGVQFSMLLIFVVKVGKKSSLYRIINTAPESYVGQTYL